MHATIHLPAAAQLPWPHRSILVCVWGQCNGRLRQVVACFAASMQGGRALEGRKPDSLDVRGVRRLSSCPGLSRLAHVRGAHLMVCQVVPADAGVISPVRAARRIYASTLHLPMPRTPPRTYDATMAAMGVSPHLAFGWARRRQRGVGAMEIAWCA